MSFSLRLRVSAVDFDFLRMHQDWSRDFDEDSKHPIYNLERFAIVASTIEIDYVMRHDNWIEPLKTTVNKENQAKDILINKPHKPDPAIGLNVMLSFKNNINDSFRPIILRL